MNRAQVTFETTGLTMLLVATRSPEKVLVPGLIFLPGLRGMWLGWVRAVVLRR